MILGYPCIKEYDSKPSLAVDNSHSIHNILVSQKWSETEIIDVLRRSGMGLFHHNKSQLLLFFRNINEWKL